MATRLNRALKAVGEWCRAEPPRGGPRPAPDPLPETARALRVLRDHRELARAPAVSHRDGIALAQVADAPLRRRRTQELELVERLRTALPPASGLRRPLGPTPHVANPPARGAGCVSCARRICGRPGWIIHPGPPDLCWIEYCTSAKASRSSHLPERPLESPSRARSAGPADLSGSARRRGSVLLTSGRVSCGTREFFRTVTTGTQQMFLATATPIRKQLELSRLPFFTTCFMVLPRSSGLARTLATSRFFLAGRCSSRPERKRLPCLFDSRVALKPSPLEAARSASSSHSAIRRAERWPPLHSSNTPSACFAAPCAHPSAPTPIACYAVFFTDIDR